MNKTIKKIVALGFTGVMAATTLAVAANAATLADYPSPFVANGAFVGKIVIGEKAAAVDTLGSMDIAASLQRASSTGVGSTSGGSTASAEDGYLFSESTELILGNSMADVITVLDDTELPDLLASGTIEDSDGSDYDYDVEIQFTDGNNDVSSDVSQHDLDEEYSAPIVYYEVDGAGTDVLYSVYIDFDKQWDAETFADSESIELFGRAYTFDPNNDNADDILTLFGSDTTLLVGKGETKTVTYNDKEYTIEVLGGNSDDSSAILRIGSETKTVTEGSSRTLGGLPIYVKDVFVSNIGGEDVSVQLFIGSNKIELDEDGTVTLNGVESDSVTFAYTQGTHTKTWDNVDTMTFTVNPVEDDVEYILPGGDYVDPLFGSFKFHFVGAEDLMEGKELTEFTRSGKKLNLNFMPRGASEDTTVSLFEGTTVAGVYDDFFNDADSLTDLIEDDIFVYNEEYDGTAATEDEAITHVLQIDKITDGNNVSSEDFEVVVKDLTFGKTYTVDSDTKAVNTKIDLYAIEGSTENDISFGNAVGNSTAMPYNPIFFTNAGAKIEILGADNATAIADATEIDGNNWFQVTEDVDDDQDTSTVDVWKVTAIWDPTDDEYDVGVTGVANGATDDDENFDHYLTDFGTYIVEETDDGGQYVKMYVPDKEVSYDMFLLPIDSTVTVTSTGGGSAVALNPIAVGMAILDTDANLGSKPYIVVGGPCANTVAAELMGSGADCAAGFTEGKAMIKMYSDKNALLVAGYSGKDTQGASRVLSNYKDYAFSGTELEVITTNLNSLSVNKVN